MFNYAQKTSKNIIYMNYLYKTIISKINVNFSNREPSLFAWITLLRLKIFCRIWFTAKNPIEY